MTALVWVIILLVVGLAVMVLEVFLPSGGILGFLSLTAIVAAIATAFMELGATAGLVVLAVATVVVPTVLALAFRWFPETPLGRRVLPPPPDPADVAPSASRRRALGKLVGRGGRAVSEMLPWGVVEIDGMQVEALSDGGPIERGAAVEAVGVQGRDLVVTPIRVQEPSCEAAEPVRSEPRASGPEAPDTADRLSPTLETFDFERLDPPST
ncbi:MAG: NfeD family protein [Planctomycetia bacterium]